VSVAHEPKTHFVCRICQKNILSSHNLPARPVVNNLREIDSEPAQHYPMTIYWCEHCLFLQLKHEIDRKEFYTSYATPSSWKLEPHMEELIERYFVGEGDCVDESVLDIGSNDGKLLVRLSELGRKNILGVEPSWDSMTIASTFQCNVISDYFSLELAETILQMYGKFSTIISRHVLEHVEDLHDFVKGIAVLSSDKTRILIEVPDCVTFFEENDFAFWEEHVNYFSKWNLIDLFERFGFEFVNWQTFVYSGRAQLVEFRYHGVRANPQTRDVTKDKTFDFSMEKIKKNILQTSNDFLFFRDTIKAKNGSVVLFGVGCRSLGTLYTFDAIGAIDYFVDSNPKKCGKVVPGTAKMIQAESSLGELSGDEVVLLGVGLENERQVIEKISKRFSKIYSMLSPSSILWNTIDVK
jgi:SAM-dependent methyltransferase